jgi:hypothetical protein
LNRRLGCDGRIRRRTGAGDERQNPKDPLRSRLGEIANGADDAFRGPDDKRDGVSDGVSPAADLYAAQAKKFILWG